VALDALEEARRMPPGAQRNAADNPGVISPKSNSRT